MQATAKDLRFHTKEILESISRGEEVVITYRGKPHAKLIPFQDSKAASLPDNPLRGIWKNHKGTEDVYGYIDMIRQGRNHAR